jgi:hypothetical protein
VVSDFCWLHWRVDIEEFARPHENP